MDRGLRRPRDGGDTLNAFSLLSLFSWQFSCLIESLFLLILEIVGFHNREYFFVPVVSCRR